LKWIGWGGDEAFLRKKAPAVIAGAAAKGATLEEAFHLARRARGPREAHEAALQAIF
jgi:hypothetical protein